jgi:hypothetical protein
VQFILNLQQNMISTGYARVPTSSVGQLEYFKDITENVQSILGVQYVANEPVLTEESQFELALREDTVRPLWRNPN